MSMEKLAELAGYEAWQTVQQWEQENGTAPSRKKLPLVAEALGLTVGYLQSGSDGFDIVHPQPKTALHQFFADETHEPTEDEFAMVQQLDLHASCGNGRFEDHVVVKGGLAFKRSSLRAFGVLVREYSPQVGGMAWIMRSDNPNKKDFPDKLLPQDDRTTIVGRAVWNDNML